MGKSLSKLSFNQRRHWLIQRLIGGLLLLAAYGFTCLPARAAIFNFSAEFVNGGNPVSRNFRMWLPDAAGGAPGQTAPVRGFVFILPGSGEDWRGHVQSANFQKAATALGFGMIGATSMGWGEFDGETTGVAQSLLDAAATVAGRPEPANAPFAPMGVFQGGYNSARIAMAHPDRAIGFVSIRGGYSYDSTISISETLRVPGLTIAASQDNIVHPGFSYQDWSAWRALDAPNAYAVEWDTTHYDTRKGQSWDAAWYWIGESIRLRYPNSSPLSPLPGQTPTLQEVIVGDGWVGHAPEILPSDNINSLVPPETVEIASIAGGTFSEPLLSASWLPNEGAARAYQAFTSFDQLSRPFIPRQGPLHFALPRITDTTETNTPLFEQGETVNIVAEVDAYDLLRYDIFVEEVDFYLDSQFLGTAPGNYFTFPMDVTFPEAGIHALTAVGRDAEGQEYTTFSAVLVAPTIPEPTSCVLEIVALALFTLRRRV